VSIIVKVEPRLAAWARVRFDGAANVRVVEVMNDSIQFGVTCVYRNPT
jgi:hypothetical protein